MNYKYSYEELLERYREEVSDEELTEELVKEVQSDPTYAAETFLLLCELATPLRNSHTATGDFWMGLLAGRAAWLSTLRDKIEGEIAERKMKQDNLDKLEAEAGLDS